MKGGEEEQETCFSGLRLQQICFPFFVGWTRRPHWSTKASREDLVMVSFGTGFVSAWFTEAEWEAFPAWCGCPGQGQPSAPRQSLWGLLTGAGRHRVSWVSRSLQGVVTSVSLCDTCALYRGYTEVRGSLAFEGLVPQQMRKSQETCLSDLILWLLC